jgi:hypothetical protein
MNIKKGQLLISVYYFNWPKSWIWQTLGHVSYIFCNASKEVFWPNDFLNFMHRFKSAILPILGSYEYLASLESKIRSVPFFYIHIYKKTCEIFLALLAFKRQNDSYILLLTLQLLLVWTLWNLTTVWCTIILVSLFNIAGSNQLTLLFSFLIQQWSPWEPPASSHGWHSIQFGSK